MRTTLVILVSVILMQSCAVFNKSAKKDEISGGKVKQVIIDKEYKYDPDMVIYTIESMNLKGNILTMDVSYEGGCGTHTFDLIFSGNWAKSLPLKSTLVLKHNKGELSNKYVKETLEFDLSNIQHPNNKTIIVRVASFDGTVKYEY